MMGSQVELPPTISGKGPICVGLQHSQQNHLSDSCLSSSSSISSVHPDTGNSTTGSSSLMCNGGSKPICNGSAVQIEDAGDAGCCDVDDVVDQPEAVSEDAADTVEDTGLSSTESSQEPPSSPLSIVVTSPEGADWEPRWNEFGEELPEATPESTLTEPELTPSDESGSEVWNNQSFELYKQMNNLTEEQFEKRLEKLSKIGSPGFGSRTRLLLQTNKAKKTVSSPNSYIHRYNCVGAVGYAVVLADDRVPENDFFRPDIRFRVRLRHGNVRCEDDAAVSQREAAIKFADQNEDGPLDLILLTGRTSQARNSNTLSRLINNNMKPTDIQDVCRRDPYFYFALVDGLRRSPDSYSDQVYYSQIAYLFVPNDGQPRLAKFRLVPGSRRKQTGLLSENEDQLRPWETGRRRGEQRHRCYLRHEFMQRMEGFDAVRYVLQIQLSDDVSDEMWSPQLIWDETEHPWIDLVTIQLTTIVPLTALCRTYFNIVDKPSCLRFGPPASSVTDPRSYQHVLSAMLTRYEIEHLGRTAWANDEALNRAIARRGKITHYVTLCTAIVRDTKPRVDVYITLIGTRGRTAPHRLDHHLEDDEDDIDLDFYGATSSYTTASSTTKPPLAQDNSPAAAAASSAGGKSASQSDDQMEHYVITTEPVGEILAVSIAVRHRHLTDEWYLRYVVLSDPERIRVRHFPCQNVVLSKATLRPGEVSLPQKDCHELLRQERLLELRDRQSDYLWAESSLSHCLPDHLKANTVRELPVSDQIEAGKYAGLPWDIDPTTIETLLPFLAAAAARGLLPNIPLFHRQTSSSQMSDNLPAIGPMRRLIANSKCGGAGGGGGGGGGGGLHRGSPSRSSRQSNPAARRRWRKIRFAIAFIVKAKVPDGPKGDMCRSVQDDVDFGRFYLMGANPIWLRRCTQIPDNFAVSDRDIEGYLKFGTNLSEAAQNGQLYIADYAILADIPTVNRDADHRHLACPLVLFVVRDPTGDLIPIAIQLGQQPGPDNPIWTPRDNAEDWIMAKLWVRCADFHVQYAIAHLLKTHFVIEPFAIAMTRQLSASHPIYKLLKPHFRFTLTTNTLIRRHVLRRGCAVDKYTSLGADGFRHLMSKYVRQRFSFDELDLPLDLAERGVDDPDLLPGYFYRDDGLRLWNAISTYCDSMIGLFYADDEDVLTDIELQAWIGEVHDIGFASFPETSRRGLPTSINSIDGLSNLVTRLIFTSTCQHSATHTEALDLYGLIPGVPAMMRQPPLTKRKSTTKDAFVRTLPDQFPDAYYGSLATVLQIHRPEEHTLGEISEIYFVEPQARHVTEAFQLELRRITKAIRARNAATSILYENLIPTWIPNSVEPLPFLPKTAKEQAMCGTPSSDASSSSHVFVMTPSVPLMILPMCMYLARTMGGARGGPGGGRAGARGRGSVAAVAMDGEVSGPGRGSSRGASSMPNKKFNSMF